MFDRLHALVHVEPLEGHSLRLWFDDGRVGDLDLASYVRFEGVFAPMRDAAFARAARLDPVTRALAWPGGADLDAEAIHRHLKAHDALRPATVLPKRPRRLAPAVDPALPEISRFFGIVIAMYFNDHLPPHLHAIYGEHEARLSLVDLRWLEGSLPPRARGMVGEWALLHRAELLANWERAQRNEPLAPVAPLE